MSLDIDVAKVRAVLLHCEWMDVKPGSFEIDTFKFHGGRMAIESGQQNGRDFIGVQVSGCQRKPRMRPHDEHYGAAYHRLYGGSLARPTRSTLPKVGPLGSQLMVWPPRISSRKRNCPLSSSATIFQSTMTRSEWEV